MSPLQPPKSPSLQPKDPLAVVNALKLNPHPSPWSPHSPLAPSPRSPPRELSPSPTVSPRGSVSAPTGLGLTNTTFSALASPTPLALALPNVPLERRDSNPGPLHPPPSRSATASPNIGPKSLAPPPVEDGRWNTGDFELVSADNVRFRVNSYHLFSASSVFRGAAEFDNDDDGVPRRRQIHFSDDEIEAALVIRAFLRVITTGQVATTPDGTGTPSVSALRRLILFLRKYDCPVALHLVMFKVKELLSQGISVPMYTFILGATADDVDTCALALKYVSQTWNGPAGYTDVRNEGTPGAATIDPTNLPYTLWQWIPGDYMWALSRAWGKHVQDGTRLPDEFRRILAIVKGSTRPSRSSSLLEDPATGRRSRNSVGWA